MSENVKNKIIKILSEQTLLDPSEIEENLSLEDLGIDSLALVEIVFSIEETFNVVAMHYQIDKPKKIKGLNVQEIFKFFN